jgi:glycosyltransferase involved in cell wall biosynthesis
MKIALNATMFRPGQMGGVETCFLNLLLSLQEVDDKNRYSVLCDTRYAHELKITNPNFKVLSCNYTKPSAGWFIRGIIRNTTKIDILRPVMNRLEVDVIHHPFSILNPLQLASPSVLTFHDMVHEFFPEYFSPFELKGRKEFYRPSAEQATRIIAISEHAKTCLVEKYEIAPGKIDVIYNGINSQYRIIEDHERLEKIRSKYGLHRPFLYYPAATLPHKNHKALLAALKLLKDRYRFDGQLVLTGIAMKANSEIMDEIGRLGLKDTVKVLGYLPYEDLPCLYNLAWLMVFPSLFEGFGIPLVEAMACGCPVACSNVTSIPEVIGDAGLTFDPNSVEDLAEKVYLLWTDEEQKKTLRIKGLQRAGSKVFSWENTARETINVYKKATGQ